MSIIKSHDITIYGGTKYEIVLRPLSDKHLPLLYKWEADPEVLYWTEGGEDVVRSYDKDTVHKIYGGVSQNAFCFLVEVDGLPVGECWLQKMNLKNVLDMYDRSIDVRRIDMAIGEKEYWNKGIGSEFIPMLIDFAFNTERVDVLHCLCEDYNPRSRRLWEKNGFELVLSEALPQPQKGKYQYHFRLTREEYTNKKRGSDEITATTIVMRGYKDTDADACRMLWGELAQHHAKLYEDPSIAGEDPGRGFEPYMSNASLAGVWVAEVGGKVVGTAGLITSGEEGEIEPVIVSSGYRAKGIGTLLINHVTGAAKVKGVRFLSIRPVARNIEALKLFARLGFNLAGHIELFQDLQPTDRHWKEGIVIHDSNLQY